MLDGFQLDAVHIKILYNMIRMCVCINVCIFVYDIIVREFVSLNAIIKEKVGELARDKRVNIRRK